MTEAKAIHLDSKFSAFSDQWQPRIVAELNGQEVKVVKIQGEFPWHHHDDIDELFLGWRGTFRMDFRSHSVNVGPGDMLVVPRGVEHRPVAEQECEMLLFEPAAVRNTGNLEDSPFLAQNGVRL